MLFFGDLDFVVVRVLDVVLAVLVLVLWLPLASVRPALPFITYVEHRQIIIALLHSVIDSVHEARVVLSALRDIVGTSARRSGDVVAHDLRDQLRSFLPVVLQRLVLVGVGLHDEVDVGLQSSKLSPVVAVAVV